MTPPSTTNSTASSSGRSADRFSTLRACEPCRRRKRRCNGQRPCLSCTKPNECIYAAGVFTTSTARRLSSGSACETCRRRKTKCDGNHPCAYCAANHLNCVNHTIERRKQRSAATSTTSTTLATTNETRPMDRIEDRLRRIERLMTVFTPDLPSSSSTYFVRQQRHSVQGITVAKEQLQMARRAISSSPPPLTGAPITPPNSGKQHSAKMARQVSQPLAFSMLNLSLSPSSSTVSSPPMPPQSSLSTPLLDQQREQLSFPMPSLMDQLSHRTFIPNHSEYPVRTSYPIYPLSPSPPAPPTTTYAEASFSP